MAESEKNEVQLGFVEARESWRLASRFFPSKLGGRPAWLQPDGLPSPEQLSCRHCSEPLVFLCQLYSPLEERPDCFHRTLFVFYCRTASCSDRTTGGGAVFRCQLPLKNDFYPDTPAEEESASPDGARWQLRRLCAVCGVDAPKQCAGCKTVRYCSKSHQTADWKAGHRELCSDGKPGDFSRTFLLPEAEIVIEEEPTAVVDSEKSEQHRLEEFKQFVSAKGQSLPDADVGDLESAATGGEDDVQYWRFRKRVAREPEQVVRYQRAGQPLWVGSQHQPQSAADQPSTCQRCGEQRHFEFQIMPQMLIHLQLDSKSGHSVDWGTLAVYTCSNSCTAAQSETAAYVEEFLWKQPM